MAFDVDAYLSGGTRTDFDPNEFLRSSSVVRNEKREDRADFDPASFVAQNQIKQSVGAPMPPEEARLLKIRQQEDDFATTRVADPNAWQKTWESIRRGNIRKKLNEALAKAGATGDEDTVAEVHERIQEFDKLVQSDPIESEKRIANWWYSAMQSVGGGMLQSILTGLAVDAVAGAVTAAAVNIPDPTDVATIPAAFLATRKALRGSKVIRGLMRSGQTVEAARRLGFAADKAGDIAQAYNTIRKIDTVSGVAKRAIITTQWAAQGKGEIMSELIKRDIDPAIREPISNFAGLIYGAVENIGGLERINPLQRVAQQKLKDIVGQSTTRAVTAAVGKYGLDVVLESLEEAAQEQVVQTATNVAITREVEKGAMEDIDQQLNDPNLRLITGMEQVRRDWEAFKSSLGPMAILGLAGGGPEIAAAALRKGKPQEPGKLTQVDVDEIQDEVDARELFNAQLTPEREEARRRAFEIDKKDLGEAVLVEEDDEIWDAVAARENLPVEALQAAANMVRAYSQRFSGKEVVFLRNADVMNGFYSPDAVYVNMETPKKWMLQTFAHEGISHEMYKWAHRNVAEGEYAQTPEQAEVADILDQVLSKEYVKNDVKFEEAKQAILAVNPDLADSPELLNEEFRARIFEKFMADETFLTELINEDPNLFQRLLGAIQRFFEKMSTVFAAWDEASETGALISREEMEDIYGGDLASVRDKMVEAGRKFLRARRAAEVPPIQLEQELQEAVTQAESEALARRLAPAETIDETLKSIDEERLSDSIVQTVGTLVRDRLNKRRTGPNRAMFTDEMIRDQEQIAARAIGDLTVDANDQSFRRAVGDIRNTFGNFPDLETIEALRPETRQQELLFSVDEVRDEQKRRELKQVSDKTPP